MNILEPLHIIEPTLQDCTGHCHSFIASICSVSSGYPLHLWVSENANLPEFEGAATFHRHFKRRWRKLQAFALYKLLLRESGTIFISTASRLDVMFLNWGARGTIPPGKVTLYFHWIRSSSSKKRFFSKIALLQPNICFITPTESVASFFRECGISNVTVIPYPVELSNSSPHNGAIGFKYLLYAGAARQDKGFGFIVDFVEYLVTKYSCIPIQIQVSPEHYGKLEESVVVDIHRLQSVLYQWLKLCTETLTVDDYKALFNGAICIQLYNQKDFADRVSGVTLDAMSAGAPVITLNGTWIARLVQRYDAGIVVDNTFPETIEAAAQQIIANYDVYSDRAFRTGQVIIKEHDAGFLFSALVGHSFGGRSE